MKLFGNDLTKEALKETEPLRAEALDEALADSAEQADADKLVLDIEGLKAEAEQISIPELKADPDVLPERREVEAAPESNPEAEEPAEPEPAERPFPEIELAPTEILIPESDAEPAAETESEPAAEAESEPAAEAESEPAAEPAKDEEQLLSEQIEAVLAGQEFDGNAADSKVSALTYESVAEAVETAKREPTGRFNRDAIDDETLLSELYTLIGSTRKGAGVSRAAAPGFDEAAVVPQPAPMEGSMPSLTVEELQTAPEEYEELPEDDSSELPGWIKGALLLLISLLMSAMTFYGVASDLLGKVF